MSLAATLAFPGGRTLAGWRRQLAAHAPEAIWAGYLSFLRVETPVLVEHRAKLPHFEQFLLKAAVSLPGPIHARELAEWTYLEPGLIQSVLRSLRHEGLLTLDGEGVKLTATGRVAATRGDYSKDRRERTTLYFWHGEWMTPALSRFVFLPHPERIGWLPAAPAPFHPDLVRNCVRRSDEWKQQHGFPLVIRDILCKPAGAVAEAVDDVMLATPERFFAVVARTRGVQGTILLAFPVNVRNWEMTATAPVFRLIEDEPGWFPPALSEDALRRAFVEWCRQREISLNQAQSCGLSLAGDHLCAETSSAGLQKLRDSHGESWLLAGDGLVKAALHLDFV